MSTQPFEPFISWTTGWTDVLDTGSWRTALPVHEWRPSPCHATCPVGGTIPGWLKLVGEGAYEEAWRLLVQENPLPAVTGRVCHHPCESDCNRAQHDEAVGINAVEHFLADVGLEAGWALPLPETEIGVRVAVVGGGPAGLACAYHLRRLGFGVTIFEARPELGGLLRYGIPEYRLPKAVLRQEIERLLDMGIEVRTSTPIADADALAALESEYEAVFVALGAQRAKGLSHLNDRDGLPVFDGLEFLSWTNDPRREMAGGAGVDLGARLGERLVVIGGGSAAMDVARSARRLGRSVTVICLERRSEMPAQAEEVEQALEEGVTLVDGAMVRLVERLVDGSLALSCIGVTLDGEPAPGESSPGVPRPVVIDDSAFELPADGILVAVGQEASLEGFDSVLATDAGMLAVDGDTLRTSRPGVFAGGDVTSPLRFVSNALGDGKRAAYSIAADLEHAEAALPERYLPEKIVQPQQVNLHYFTPAPRRERDRLSVAERLADFSEAAMRLSTEAATGEAERCLSCGTCLECDICVLFCPDLALRKDGSHPEGYEILEQFCKGCGLCVAECPRGVVRLTQEHR